jgi:hypothetical protein
MRRHKLQPILCARRVILVMTIRNFVLYINDLLLTNNERTKITWLIDQLKKRFEMSKLENLCKYFSIEFVYILDGIFVYQCNYVKKNLK